MHKELRFDKQILEELFDAKFLCASFHVKFINCCRDITPGQWKISQKVAQMCQNWSEKYLTLMIKMLPIFKLYIHIIQFQSIRNPEILPICQITTQRD